MIPGALVAVAGVTVAGGLAGAVLVPAALATAGADHRLAGRVALAVGVALVVWGGLVAAVAATAVTGGGGQDAFRFPIGLAVALGALLVGGASLRLATSLRRLTLAADLQPTLIAVQSYRVVGGVFRAAYGWASSRRCSRSRPAWRPPDRRHRALGGGLATRRPSPGRGPVEPAGHARSGGGAGDRRVERAGPAPPGPHRAQHRGPAPGAPARHPRLPGAAVAPPARRLAARDPDRPGGGGGRRGAHRRPALIPTSPSAARGRPAPRPRAPAGGPGPSPAGRVTATGTRSRGPVACDAARPTAPFATAPVGIRRRSRLATAPSFAGPHGRAVAPARALVRAPAGAGAPRAAGGSSSAGTRHWPVTLGVRSPVSAPRVVPVRDPGGPRRPGQGSGPLAAADHGRVGAGRRRRERGVGDRPGGGRRRGAVAGSGLPGSVVAFRRRSRVRVRQVDEPAPRPLSTRVGTRIRPPPERGQGQGHQPRQRHDRQQRLRHGAIEA